ncbi:CAP domain-containing protein, partial [Salinibacter sp.]|uniref:CAP domain-containing protein n=1 Tax=Salinibacter sp. TaxID=2065818 RepID=UPI003FA6EA75
MLAQPGHDCRRLLRPRGLRRPEAERPREPRASPPHRHRRRKHSCRRGRGGGGRRDQSEIGKTSVEGWMDSPGHRRNISKPRYTHIGACYTDHTRGHGTQLFATVYAYLDQPLPWTMSLGDPVSTSVTPAKVPGEAIRYVFVSPDESGQETLERAVDEEAALPLDGVHHVPKQPGRHELRVFFQLENGAPSGAVRTSRSGNDHSVVRNPVAQSPTVSMRSFPSGVGRRGTDASSSDRQDTVTCTLSRFLCSHGRCCVRKTSRRARRNLRNGGAPRGGASWKFGDR